MFNQNPILLLFLFDKKNVIVTKWVTIDSISYNKSLVNASHEKNFSRKKISGKIETRHGHQTSCFALRSMVGSWSWNSNIEE